jgi:hypothetical protein
MPDFPRKVRLSEHRRSQYYIKNKVISGNQKLPADCLIELNPNTTQWIDHTSIIIKTYKATKRLPARNKYFMVDNEKYAWKLHKKTKGLEERLVDLSTGEYIIKNHLTAGTPNDEIINGQSMYNGVYNPFTRDKIMKVLHAYMIPFLQGLEPIKEYPLIIEGFMYDKGKTCEISKGKMWDVGNRQFPYNKAFEDMLQHCGVIKQDDFEHIIGAPRLVFRNLDDGVSSNNPHYKDHHIGQVCVRKLVYQIYKVNE